MKTFIAICVLIAISYSPGEAISCTDGTNPCKLDNSTFNLANGYQCIPRDPNNVMCTCPGGFEDNKPCRPCARTDPANNICKGGVNPLIFCLDTTDYGSTYACLCQNPSGGDPVPTLSPVCDLTATITSTKPTLPPLNCQNGGISANGICNCPSGYSGTSCGTYTPAELCERISCKNGGVCGIQPAGGGYQSRCLCKAGFSGDYCELTGTSGFCSANFCQNNGACQEVVVGIARYAYCACPPGVSGTKCENKYFTCSSVGSFPDSNMSDQGYYFECLQYGGGYQIQKRACPKGLRFSSSLKLCTL